MVEVVRLVTVHPVLVHLSLGGAALLLVAYAVAWHRRSERWAFAADVTLAFTAGSALLTGAFGLVSNGVIEWPGGLGTWRWLHFAFGLTTTTLLVAFAIGRGVVRKRQPLSGAGSFAAAMFIALVATFTGFAGGEVLVFHAGVAVRAAGNGALAPPVSTASPSNLDEAMGDLRASYAAAMTRAQRMLVHHPRPDGFQDIAGHAARIEELAGWLVRQGGAGAEQPQPRPEGQHATPRASAVSDPNPPGHEHEREHQHGSADPRALVSTARLLGRQASELRAAAESDQLSKAFEAAGRLGSTCTSCHRMLRRR